MLLFTPKPTKANVERLRRPPLTLIFVALLSIPFVAPAQKATEAKRDAILDARDAHGLTRLVIAASSGDTATMNALVAQGAGLDVTAKDGRTALIAAVQSGKVETVEALVAAGANLDLAARGTGTPLNEAENHGETQIAALLLASGAHPTGKSVGDTVCVRPWGGEGFCGRVTSFSIRSVAIKVAQVVGCRDGCQAKQECSAGRTVGGNGIQPGEQVAVPSWCLTQTGVKP